MCSRNLFFPPSNVVLCYCSQNVNAAVKLLRAIVALGEAPASDIPGLEVNLFLTGMHEDIQVFFFRFSSCLEK